MTPWVQVDLPEVHGKLNVGHGYAAVEASLPLVAGEPTNVVPARPEDAEHLCRRLVNAGLGRLELTQAGELLSESSFRFTRVDVVRDFHRVDDFDHILDTIQFALRDNNQSYRRFSKNSTISTGPGEDWQASLYDKHAESKGAASPGAVRFELKLRSDRLRGPWAQKRSGRWLYPSDITRDAAYAMACDTFHDVRFGSVGLPAPTLLRRVEALGLSPSKAAKLIGLAHEPSLLRSLSSDTRSDYRGLLSQLGPIALPAAATCGLDFETGTQS